MAHTTSEPWCKTQLPSLACIERRAAPLADTKDSPGSNSPDAGNVSLPDGVGAGEGGVGDGGDGDGAGGAMVVVVVGGGGVGGGGVGGGGDGDGGDGGDGGGEGPTDFVIVMESITLPSLFCTWS